MRSSSPVARSSPNSNLVSARMIPARPRSPAAVRAIELDAPTLAGPARPARARRCAGHRVEVDVLVVLAQLGLGRGREDRLGQPVALAQARRQRDAARRRRSPGSPSSRSRRGSRGRRPRPAGPRPAADHHPAARRDRRRRPSATSCSAMRPRPVGRPSRWFGTIDAVSANQNRDRPVRTRPLSGIVVGRTTSKALIRSDATSSSRSSGRSIQVADLARADERAQPSARATSVAACVAGGGRGGRAGR